MKNALVIEPNDIKAILAEKYGVPENSIIKSQYSYTVILDQKAGDTNDKLESTIQE